MIFKERRELRKRVAELEEMLMAINREADEQYSLAMRATAKVAEAGLVIQQLQEELAKEKGLHELPRLKLDKALRYIEALEKGIDPQEIEALKALRGW